MDDKVLKDLMGDGVIFSKALQEGLPQIITEEDNNIKCVTRVGGNFPLFSYILSEDKNTVI